MRVRSIYFFIVIAALLVNSNSKAQPVTIMPLGNSITQANNTHVSYRYPLWKKLIDDSLNFDYVGSLINNKNGNPVWPDYIGHVFDQNHEGHWGWRADQILNGNPSVPGEHFLTVWLQSYTPEIALIHLGSNDIIQYQTVESTILDLHEVITTIRNCNPQIIILLAQLIPTSLPVNTNINTLNAMIPGLALELADPGSPIYIVDQNTGFDAATDTYDGIHPNEIGEEKMAQKWRDAIMEAMHPILNVKVFLEGPFNGSCMSTSLSNLIPFSQPFDCSPWNYFGTEEVTDVPSDIVDWVLVEIRDTTSVAIADENCIVMRRACLLDSLGVIRDISGSQDLNFNVIISDSLFIVIYHRNHLPIISSVPLVKTFGKYCYDFTNGVEKAFGAGSAQKNIGIGLYGMVAGDCKPDGLIDLKDIFSVWLQESGGTGYLVSDLNLNTQVSNTDKNDLLLLNLGYHSMVPVSILNK